jgi:hypothetical protein
MRKAIAHEKTGGLQKVLAEIEVFCYYFDTASELFSAVVQQPLMEFRYHRFGGSLKDAVTSNRASGGFIGATARCAGEPHGQVVSLHLRPWHIITLRLG